MELLKSIGLTAEELKKVSPELTDAIEELEEISIYAQSKDAPRNIKDAYSSLYGQIEKTVTSTTFIAQAKKKGLEPFGGMDEADRVEVKPMEKVKSISIEGILAGETLPMEDVEITEEKPKEKSKSISVEGILAGETLPMGDIDIPDTEEPPTEVTETGEVGNEYIYGVYFSGDKSGEFTARERLTMMLSYGGCDYSLGYYRTSAGHHYLLELPDSLARMFITLSDLEANSELNSILKVWQSYADDNSAQIKIIGRDKEMLETFVGISGGAALRYAGTISKEKIQESDNFDHTLYEPINDEYSHTVGGYSDTYYAVKKRISDGWESKKFSIDTLYGLNYTDYVYTPASEYYKKGGLSIVTKKMTFYVPKGLKKDETFAETGEHLSKIPIKTSKFDKNVDIGKRFQVNTNKFEDAIICRIVCSQGHTVYGEWDANDRRAVGYESELFLISDQADTIKIDGKAYAYFRKYYGVNIQLKLSDSTILVYNGSGVVGMIPAKKYTTESIVGVLGIEEFKTELRNIDPKAFDFMVSADGEVESPVEVEEIEEEAKVGEEEQEEEKDKGNEALKEELADRIEFLEDLKEDAVEENDNPKLISELEMELETLRDILEDLTDE